MRKLFAGVLCAAALVGCGPMDESELAGSQQAALIQPDGLPGEPKVDPAQLNIAPVLVPAQDRDFADHYVWGLTERPGGCHK